MGGAGDLSGHCDEVCEPREMRLFDLSGAASSGHGREKKQKQVYTHRET